MELIIRNIEEEDISSVVDIQLDGWKTAYKEIIDNEYLESMSREEKIQKRKNDYKNGGFIVAESNNEIVGFCRYSSKVISYNVAKYNCELLALYVKSNLKGNGIGKALFDTVKRDLQNQGKTKMILWCLKENYSSRKFYEKMGGKIVAEKDIEIGGKLYPEVGFGYEL